MTATLVTSGPARTRAARARRPGADAAQEATLLRDADARLLERIASGEGRALADLYDRHGRAAYALALRVTADRELAEDAVQEAFCALWRQAGRYRRARGTVASFLLALVHHKAVDAVRREQARRRPLHPDDLADGPRATLEQEVLARDDGERARRALARLGDEQRRLLSLLYLDGLTQREVAHRLGVPLGTVKSRTHAAMNALRRQLAVV